MLPHQERLIEEKRDLEAKIEKLLAFILDANFDRVPSQEQWLLRQQYLIMKEYADILALRVRLIPKST